MKYVAFLRGINVGGNNKVDMKQLKAALEAHGFSKVSTYINSGNIFFSDSTEDASVLMRRLETVIKSTFNLDIKMLIVDEKTITTVAKAIPSDWVNDSTMRTDVMFLWDEINDKSILERIVIKPGIDRVKYVPGALIWNVQERKLVTRSGMIKLANSELIKHMTVRNCNTVRKLYQLLV